eukprot:scaffold19230_cov129-Isochrysis_galbana.AAC.3
MCVRRGAPATQSPTPNTSGLLVAKRESTRTPCPETCSTPAALRPRSSVLGVRPVATSSTSHSRLAPAGAL